MSFRNHGEEIEAAPPTTKGGTMSIPTEQRHSLHGVGRVRCGKPYAQARLDGLASFASQITCSDCRKHYEAAKARIDALDAADIAAGNAVRI